MRKKVVLFLFFVLGGFWPGLRADVLPPEKLLPKDTILVVTIPDCATGWTVLTNIPYGRLWSDPQFKPFKNKFIDKFSSDVIAPMERTLSIRWADYQGLAQGQATLALLPVSQPERPEQHFSFIFILDSKSHAAQLKTNLADIRQKWSAAGKPMKARKIREVDFTTLVLSPDDLSWEKILSKPKTPGSPDETARGTNKVELTIGQSDSLLVVSDSTQAIEKVLSRQTGGLVPGLEEEPLFRSDFAAHLHDAPLYAWANVKSAMENLTKSAGDEEGVAAALRPDSLLGALGLTGLTSASLSYRNSTEGLSALLFVGVPESTRRGLLNALVAEPKDANPPAFVPADVTKFWRWRIDLPHAWAQIEKMLNDSTPQYASLINFVLQTAGKDKDEHYDLKSQLLSNLGDDIIHYEKAPQGNTLADLNSAPSIYLIGSPNPEKLAAAVKTGLSFMGTAKDREFLGRQICTLTATPQPGAPSRSLSFSGSGGYLAISADPGILEEYLRSSGNKDAKALASLPGLAEAAQRVGGMSTGLFGFDNQNIAMRATVETVRQQPVTLQDIMGSSPVMGGVNTGDQAAKLRDWADFSLLPPYDAISQYFYFSVFGGAFTPDGFSMTFFAPTPPKLR